MGEAGVRVTGGRGRGRVLGVVNVSGDSLCGYREEELYWSLTAGMVCVAGGAWRIAGGGQV